MVHRKNLSINKKYVEFYINYFRVLEYRGQTATQWPKFKILMGKGSSREPRYNMLYELEKKYHEIIVKTFSEKGGLL